MPTILKEEILVRSQAVVARVVAGETLIFPVRDRVGDLASIYSLNSTASLIWKLLGSPRTLTQLAIAFAQEYEVEPEIVRGDVADFLNEMMAVGMVELSASVMMAEAEGPWGAGGMAATCELASAAFRSDGDFGRTFCCLKHFRRRWEHGRAHRRVERQPVWASPVARTHLSRRTL
jgi:hypothetical protein